MKLSEIALLAFLAGQFGSALVYRSTEFNAIRGNKIAKKANEELEKAGSVKRVMYSASLNKVVEITEIV